MLFTCLSLKEKGDTDLAFELLSLQLETLYSTFFIVFITECVVPAWVYQDHILELLCFLLFVMCAQWVTLKSYFLQQNFNLILHSLLFNLSSEVLKFIISDLAVCLFAGSLFGNSTGYLLDISVMFFWNTAFCSKVFEQISDWNLNSMLPW